MIKYTIGLWVTVIAFCSVSWASEIEVRKNEQQLLSSLQAIQNLDLDTAINQISHLSEAYPEYQLAQLIKADLLALKSGNRELMQSVRGLSPQRLQALEDEARVRWQFSRTSVESVPPVSSFVLKAGPEKYLLMVDLQDNRLFIYQKQAGQKLERVADFYVSMGAKGSGKLREGDKKTPLGIYHISDSISAKDLPDFYGTGALPINYPNPWDKHLNRTGSGIWLHGVPSHTYARSPGASRGCVVLSNKAMEVLMSDYQLPLTTPVIIWDRQKEVGAFLNQRQTISQLQSLFMDRYPKMAWQSVAVYRYPHEKGLYYLTFPAGQEGYKTHQFWRHDTAGWELLSETREPVEIQYQFK